MVKHGFANTNHSGKWKCFFSGKEKVKGAAFSTKLFI